MVDAFLDELVSDCTIPLWVWNCLEFVEEVFWLENEIWMLKIFRKSISHSLASIIFDHLDNFIL